MRRSLPHPDPCSMISLQLWVRKCVAVLLLLGMPHGQVAHVCVIVSVSKSEVELTLRFLG